ncbi:PREDICTED: RING-H2 finger protein ATL79-like [Nelumbo nucifera]|uniref:RING-type domain-containing protein n=2 Tax=Nelumbo nucifera TaxID=4432 RepID=A0A822X9L0_NELNU|nr:PREDICTED: RING-H2 finger protein ATL79-like [Nelumbo nucifera]DAD18164.1 TPA_asm: hypothetical protein HUJ06_019627 [Nelumbo nucifera]
MSWLTVVPIVTAINYVCGLLAIASFCCIDIYGQDEEDDELSPSPISEVSETPLSSIIYGSCREWEGDECTVCLEGFLQGQCCRLLPNCQHLFHAKCIDVWFLKASTSPICRTEVALKVSNNGSSAN